MEGNNKRQKQKLKNKKQKRKKIKGKIKMTQTLSLRAKKIQVKESWPQNTLFWLKDVFHIYKTRYVETVALKNLNVHIKRGEYLGILGPSGSGKSTFMNILGGLLVPTTGRVYFKPNETESEIINIARFDLFERTQYRRDNIGFIFQEFKLFNYLTAEENVEVPFIIRNINPKDKKEEITQILQACGIEHRREYKIDQLSGGEKQRIQVATALVSHPKIILADEPTGNLDSVNSQNIFELLKTVAKKYNTTVVTVTHDLRIKEYCDRTLTIKDGQIQEKLAIR